MKKYLILFLVILIYASCDNNADFHDVIEEHYYRILLKEWQKRVDQQPTLKQEFLDTPAVNGREAVNEEELENTIHKAVMDNYNIDVKKDHYVGYGTYKRNERLWLIHYKKSFRKKQIWMLISAKNGMLLSTCMAKSKMSKREVRDILRRREEEIALEQERRREDYIAYVYERLLGGYEYMRTKSGFDIENAFACPEPNAMLYNFYQDNVNSAYLRKIDSTRYYEVMSGPPDEIHNKRYINQCSFKQSLKMSCDSEDNKSIDSVTAVKLATAAAANCYGSKMTPFAARLVGENKEHWMVYCFPTIPDNMEKQTICYVLNTSDYNEQKQFNTGCHFQWDICRGCPVVFIVLISRKNGLVLTINEAF